MKGKEKAFALGCAAVGIGALLLRLDFLAAYRQSPLFENLFIDPETYHRWASLLASGADWTDGGVYPRAPLYIWFLALLHKLSGGSLLLPRDSPAWMFRSGPENETISSLLLWRYSPVLVPIQMRPNRS